MPLATSLQKIGSGMAFDLIIDKDKKRFVATNDKGHFITETEVYFALFTNRRADKSEISNPLSNSGYIGELFLNETQPRGSKLWLLTGLPLNDDSIKARAELYIRQALNYLIVAGRASNVLVDIYNDESTVGEHSKNFKTSSHTTNSVAMDLEIVVISGEVNKFNLLLWETAGSKIT